MAKIRSGILGNTRGKVSGVVASQWKDVNYIREFVKPANPNTVAQQAQRSKMSLAVNYIRPIIGTILNVYMDKFFKSMSAYNGFIRDNIAKFVAPINMLTITITTGKLFTPVQAGAEVTDATGAIVIDFSTSLGSNGLGSDGVFAAVYDVTLNRWRTASAEADRSVGEQDVAMGYDTTGNVLYSYIFAVQRVGTTISIVSDSDPILVSHI